MKRLAILVVLLASLTLVACEGWEGFQVEDFVVEHEGEEYKVPGFKVAPVNAQESPTPSASPALSRSPEPVEGHSRSE
jgi:hypothetical protein